MRRATALVLLTFAASTAFADDLQLGPDHWLRQRVQLSIHPRVTSALVRDGMREYFYNSDFDGHGVSVRSYDIFFALRRGRERSAEIGSLVALDLDGDGVVSRAEIETVARYNAVRSTARSSVDRYAAETRQRLAKTVADEVARRLAHDRNSDDRLTLDEIVAGGERMREAAEALAARSDRRTPDERRARMVADLVPLALDADGDGVVSLAEYDAAVDAIFREYDDDGDGTISVAEAAAHKTHAGSLRKAAVKVIEDRRTEQALRERTAGCALPTIPPDVGVVLFSTFGGSGISTVGLGGTELVEVADIVVEPGRDPLAIVLTSRHPMIWDIGGAADRVVRVIVAADDREQPLRAAPGGVVGLPREKIAFAGRSDCVPVFLRPDDQDKTIATFAALSGRRADSVLGVSQAGSVQLPSGQNVRDAPLRGAIAPPKHEPAAELDATMRHDHPAGLVALDPGEIVSTSAAIRLPVLPLDAGVAQLIDEGALTISRYSHGYFLEGAEPKPFREPSEFVVKRKVRMPPGLTQSGLVLVLAAGVPMPDGDFGKTCILDEARKPVANEASCPRR